MPGLLSMNGTEKILAFHIYIIAVWTEDVFMPFRQLRDRHLSKNEKGLLLYFSGLWPSHTMEQRRLMT